MPLRRLMSVTDGQAIASVARTVAGGMEMALDMLSTKKIVELDVDRRSALVSNLMVVLCSERDTQPIVNAGTAQH